MKSTKQQKRQCFQSKIKDILKYFYSHIWNFWPSWFRCLGNLKIEKAKQNLLNSISELTTKFLQWLLEIILALLAVFQTYVYEIILTLIWWDEGKKRRGEWTGFQQMVTIVEAIYRITDELQSLLNKYFFSWILWHYKPHKQTSDSLWHPWKIQRN